MSRTHVGYDGHIRAGNGAHGFDLAQATHTHLHHCNIRIRLNSQQCTGQTDFIIEICLGLHNVISGSQYCRHHVLR